MRRARATRSGGGAGGQTGEVGTSRFSESHDRARAFDPGPAVGQRIGVSQRQIGIPLQSPEGGDGCEGAAALPHPQQSLSLLQAWCEKFGQGTMPERRHRDDHERRISDGLERIGRRSCDGSQLLVLPLEPHAHSSGCGHRLDAGSEAGLIGQRHLHPGQPQFGGDRQRATAASQHHYPLGKQGHSIPWPLRTYAISCFASIPLKPSLSRLRPSA